MKQITNTYQKHFSRSCESRSNSETNDAQPEILTHSANKLHVRLDTNADLSSQLLPRIKLVNSKEVMECRTIRDVVHYHTPNKRKEPENYFHHLLIPYYPWRNEDTLVESKQTNLPKLNESVSKSNSDHMMMMMKPLFVIKF